MKGIKTADGTSNAEIIKGENIDDWIKIGHNGSTFTMSMFDNAIMGDIHHVTDIKLGRWKMFKDQFEYRTLRIKYLSWDDRELTFNLNIYR